MKKTIIALAVAIISAASALAQNIDPATGLPVAAAGPQELVDIGAAATIHLPEMKDVRLADLLDAIVLVSDKPIKYSITEFGVVFSPTIPESEQRVQLFMRTFRVNPNTFYSGLDNVHGLPFANQSSSSSGSSSGGGGGGGNNSQNSQNQQSAVYGAVEAFSGGGQARASGGQGGGGGGGGAQGGGSSYLANVSPGGAGGAGAGAGANSQGGLNYVTSQPRLGMMSPSVAAMNFFTTLGVNLQDPPGKSVFFNDRLGLLFVKATEDDLDTIERALQVLNQVPPQVHIKARFIEVSQTDNNQLGFDWYLGQFHVGNQAVAQGGSPGSLTVPTSIANPIGAFPGASLAQVIPDGGQQLFSSGLSSSAANSTTASMTGILTNPNFQVILHALQTRTGVENLGEPEVTTLSGRQTQMKATSVVTIITGVTFTQGASAISGGAGAAGGTP